MLVFLWLVVVVLPMRAQSSEPLWLRYSAISPDGKTICFTYKGDLYLVPTSGGEARQITQHEAHDMMPVWSPDGQALAFASDRFGNFDVFVLPIKGMMPAGSPQRLTVFSRSEFPTGFTPDGKNVVFWTSRQDKPSNVLFAGGVMSELYQVSVRGGQPRQILTTPAQDARWDKTGTKLLYHDRKGYEDEWRKHHISSVARDIWLYDASSGKHIKLTDFAGEDRSPVWSPDNSEVYYLSEQGTSSDPKFPPSFNVWKFPVANPQQRTQVTFHSKHPVRFLSIAGDGTLCYSFDGALYVKSPTEKESRRVSVTITGESRTNDVAYKALITGASEIAVSPNGKEVAFVVRGEVFVTSVDYGITKRITNTPEQERSVSFSPDGRSLLYAAEREGSWNIYQTTIVKDKTAEPYFFKATLLKEEPVVATQAEEFQPQYSPDGKEVAYLEERTTLKVINLQSKQTRRVLDSTKNYSYADGDQAFAWSPDSKWLLVKFLDKGRWRGEIGLIAADGKGTLQNLTQSGYDDDNPEWVLEGKAMIWQSDRSGLKNQSSGAGGESDIYAMFFTQDAFDRFRLTKDEYELLKLKETPKKDEKAVDKAGDKKDDKKEGSKDDKPAKPIVIESVGLEERVVRLTMHSSRLANAVLSLDGERLYYLARFEQGFDLWVTKPREKETKLLTKLNAQSARLVQSDDGKQLFVLTNAGISRIDTSNGQAKPIAFRAEMNLNAQAERAYFFEHAWRQTLKKFYDPQLHGVDWAFYKREYAKFLPHVSNGHEFAELLGEMLGELNASHTGGRFRPRPNPEVNDETASLGAFYDDTYTGDGLKIVEILDKSPLQKASVGIKPGMIIEKIDGEPITPARDAAALLNRKADKPVMLTVFDPASKRRFEEAVKPFTLDQENEQLYQRWIKARREDVERLSKGRIGYVHVRGMNDPSYRQTYSEMFGRHNDKEAIIIDTRFNGGGNLTEMLTTALSGKRFTVQAPRGMVIGTEPEERWDKPSVVVMGEGNYSDAHCFPCAYKALGIGETVGMDVPGTCTAVWWETLMDGETIFGIPQVGIRSSLAPDRYMENMPLAPDYRIAITPEDAARGRDTQLEKAVEVLLSRLKK
jgi:Tol biopolymer transport system component/C-terminal processing protease CtpA/Prc